MVAVLVVLFEVLCALAARADIAVGDMSTANEAAAAASLLSAFLPPYKAGVVVIGHAPWTGDLLRALPEGTPRVVLDHHVAYNEADRLVITVQQTHHVLLVLVDTLGDLVKIRTLPLVRRALIWMRVAGSPLEVVQDETFKLHLSRTRRCVDETVLALSDADGTVHLFAVDEPMKCHAWPFYNVDRWSAGERRWLRGGPLFMRFCDKWSPPPGPATAPLNLLTVMNKETIKHQTRLANIIAKYALTSRKIINTKFRFTEQTRDEADLLFRVLAARASNCSFDGLLSGYTLAPSCPLEISARFSQRLSSIVVVVPAGLGPAISPLAAVALEFSPAVWLCTALAALVTAATLAWALRRDRGDALLLVLTPLLAQAPPPPPAASPALRPLLGAWLLVCVVLVAAYQGLLLGMLTAARPRGEIDSLQALDESGLPVHSAFDVFHTIADSLPESLRNRIKIVEPPLLRAVYQQVARAREKAVIIFSDAVTEKRLETWAFHDKTVHTFQIETGQPRVIAMWHKGSELGAIITKFIGRDIQAGLDAYQQRLDDFMELLGRRESRGSKESRAGVRPLTLALIRPAFLFLAAGLALATFVFVFVEVLPGLRRQNTK
ncbi:Glutamate receptor ionotropic, delta-2 [Frankliniella fusca]|uniref:Glutamate receptor ionotropic, delta-2 n=1 Tax=Frankliniella fusca TaxID=407009 RepID=A0AAE1H6A5_9NEOP|nr:Glutamate receptor ionotropic, delta-2 [Frankliniella fusca]